MIKDTKVKIVGHSRNIKYYSALGYDIRVGEDIFINPKDLSKGSTFKITTMCENCYKESLTIFKDYWNYTEGFINPYYCKSCKYIKSKETNIIKYGVDNPMQSSEIVNKLRLSILDKYGVDWYSKTDEYKERIKETSLSKYGVDNPSKNAEIKKRIIDTYNRKYNINHPFENSIFLNKARKTYKQKYGVDWYSKTDEYKTKVKETSLSKYGVSNYSKTDECKISVVETNNIIWGGHPSKHESFKSRVKESKERNTSNKYRNIISDKYDVLEYNNDIFKLIHKDCNSEFTIVRGLLLARINLEKMICTNCNPIGMQTSCFEMEVVNYIKSLNVNYITKDRAILNGKELDIYLPDYNIAIECNGIYWHSELFKSKDYHLDKTNMCKERSINLMHIWEDDWQNKKDIIKSIISNRLGLSNYCIYGRKCSIDVVSTKECKEFLNKNHIQGFTTSSTNLGLYYNNELVSLMTFGIRRTNGKSEMELIRFCSKLGYNIIGGASRLFKHFIKTYKSYIISYADISLFSGSLYNNLGFTYEGLSKPNYYWVVDGIKRHRYNYSKRKLVKDGYDPLLTEVEIMHSRGYYRIFSTGQVRYVYKNDDNNL